MLGNYSCLPTSPFFSFETVSTYRSNRHKLKYRCLFLHIFSCKEALWPDNRAVFRSYLFSDMNKILFTLNQRTDCIFRLKTITSLSFEQTGISKLRGKLKFQFILATNEIMQSPLSKHSDTEHAWRLEEIWVQKVRPISCGFTILFEAL